MKKLLLLSLAIAAASCEQAPPKDYVTFSGKITNKTSDSVVVRSRTYTKTIPVNADGTFKDTLKVETGVYNLFDGSESTNMYLKNGFELNVTMDTKEFDETVKYTGSGAEHSNFLAEQSLLQEEILDIDKLSNLGNVSELDKELAGIKGQLNEFYTSKKGIDSTLIAEAVGSIDPMLKSYKGYLEGAITLKSELPKGSPSPVFENYENHKGGTTSLSDLKGKYVYMDIWATWCAPCKAEIPFLKEVEKKYHGKNIEFVSISVDDARRSGGGSMEKAKAKWEKMVTDLSLGGIQLISDKNWQSDFIANYKVTGIPRFILVDPDGNIVTPDAPRPSSPALIELFNELSI